MTLEDRVSELEGNAGAIGGVLEQITQALRGISTTQNEHSRLLSEHSVALRSIIATQNEHSRLLVEHSRLLGEHSEAIRAATATLNEHTRILLEHSVDIQFIKNMLQDPSGESNARIIYNDRIYGQ